MKKRLKIYLVIGILSGIVLLSPQKSSAIGAGPTCDLVVKVLSITPIDPSSLNLRYSVKLKVVSHKNISEKGCNPYPIKSTITTLYYKNIPTVGHFYRAQGMEVREQIFVWDETNPIFDWGFVGIVFGGIFIFGGTTLIVLKKKKRHSHA